MPQPRPSFLHTLAVLELEEQQFLAYVVKRAGDYRQYVVILVGDAPAKPLRGPRIKFSELPDIPAGVTAFAQIRVLVELDPPPQKEPTTTPLSRAAHFVLSVLLVHPTRSYRFKRFLRLTPRLKYDEGWETPTKVRFIKFVQPWEPMSYTDPALFIGIKKRAEREDLVDLRRRIREANESNRQFYG
ncbi:hypothetical protein DFH06DRAFT_1149690 [Mycena polygramma]|nr:hypothetical protein DFH06DRAFT_1149690 [Mycena polygramma]